MRDVLKKLKVLLEEYRRINSKPKELRSIERFVYYKLFLNKKNKFNAIRVLFLLLQSWKKYMRQTLILI